MSMKLLSRSCLGEKSSCIGSIAIGTRILGKSNECDFMSWVPNDVLTYEFSRNDLVHQCVVMLVDQTKNLRF